MATRDCPCGSAERYAKCCGVFHDGAREPETPETLMRSRYAAFALGRGDWLEKTLARDHADRATPNLARELGRVKDKQRFLGLRVLFAKGDEVLFHARIFERGVDRSFAELSTFVREDGAWRYASGILVPASELPADLDSLDRDAFLALAR
ncbi:MAG TPA: YchJ family metal-binding protein [Labilithrix sp.]|jgi:SEC-C motif-containing protein